MKYKKIISLLCVLSLFISSFSACGYELVLRKKGEGDDSTSAYPGFNGEYDISQNQQTVPGGNYNPGGNETPGTDDPSSPGFQVDPTFVQQPMSAMEVLELYTEAVNGVKLRSPGYVRNEYQEISDVTGGSGGVSLINNILNLVGTELLKDSGDEEAIIQIMAHDDIAVRETFPLYNQDVGCALTDLSIIKSAVCYSNGSSYKLVITFDDQLNPNHEDSDFAKIMTPIDREALSDPIEEYLVVLNKNTYQFDINYTNCEIICVMDKNTKKITSLRQKMIMDIDIVMNLDLVIMETNNLKASGRIINFLEYSNFDWA